MKNFRTYNLAVQFYRSTQSLSLPKALKDQLDRASASIALNLAESRGKPTLKDQLRFFHIAMGSLRECQAILELANLKSSPAFMELDSLGAHLFCLIREAK